MRPLQIDHVQLSHTRRIGAISTQSNASTPNRIAFPWTQSASLGQQLRRFSHQKTQEPVLSLVAATSRWVVEAPRQRTPILQPGRRVSLRSSLLRPQVKRTKPPQLSRRSPRLQRLRHPPRRPLLLLPRPAQQLPAQHRQPSLLRPQPQPSLQLRHLQVPEQLQRRQQARRRQQPPAARQQPPQRPLVQHLLALRSLQRPPVQERLAQQQPRQWHRLSYPSLTSVVSPIQHLAALLPPAPQYRPHSLLPPMHQHQASAVAPSLLHKPKLSNCRKPLGQRLSHPGQQLHRSQCQPSAVAHSLLCWQSRSSSLRTQRLHSRPTLRLASLCTGEGRLPIVGLTLRNKAVSSVPDHLNCLQHIRAHP